jgi:hypothetical protein
LFQEKAKVRDSIIAECRTPDGHKHFMQSSFEPYMLMVEAGDKHGKSQLEAKPLRTVVTKSQQHNFVMRVCVSFVLEYVIIGSV